MSRIAFIKFRISHFNSEYYGMAKAIYEIEVYLNLSCHENCIAARWKLIRSILLKYRNIDTMFIPWTYYAKVLHVFPCMTSSRILRAFLMPVAHVFRD